MYKRVWYLNPSNPPNTLLSYLPTYLYDRYFLSLNLVSKFIDTVDIGFLNQSLYPSWLRFQSYRCTGVDEDFEDPCFPILPTPRRDQCIRFIRSAAVCQSKPYDLKPREQINVNTAYLDASMVYGSSERVQTALRDLTSKCLSTGYSIVTEAKSHQINKNISIFNTIWNKVQNSC